jgi:hypothetical protein
MNITQARQLQPRQLVSYPADRGAPAGVATVRSADCATSTESRTLSGAPYIWVQLEPGQGVWPSNRLEVYVTEPLTRNVITARKVTP